MPALYIAFLSWDSIQVIIKFDFSTLCAFAIAILFHRSPDILGQKQTAMMTLAITALAMASTVNALPSPTLALANGDIEKIAKINVMRVFSGKLYVGGKFERANRKLVNNVAVWDGTSWSGVGKGVDGEVFDILELNGKVFVAGDFSYAGKSTESEGVPAVRIAKWDGTKWSAMGKPAVDREIYALTTDGKSVFIGGNFTKINDETETRGVAKWNGTKWEAIGGKFDRAVMTMCFHKGTLYAGGIFHNFGDDSMEGIASYDGKTWNEVGNGGLNSRVAWLSSDGMNLYAAGQFNLGGSQGIGKWDGSKWSLAAKTDNETFFVHAEGKRVYFTGDFSSINGKPSHNVGVLEDGTLKFTLNEILYAHHRTVMPFKDAIILGGGYGDVKSDEIGATLKWTGAKEIDKLVPVSE